MEYLFRGKRIDNGEWVEGDLLNKCSGSPKISIHGEYNRGLFVVDSYEVIPETVGQFTGLTDKNGKKIFEGDRIFWNSQYGVVKFGDYETSDGHKKLGFYIDWDFLCWLSESIVIATKHEPCEVIGNIHEEAQNARNI